ncbi:MULTISPECIES: DUF1173 family protein [Vibrio]|uniref:DUF1173 domain-containing protein n=1 Tax=Vibrio owensii CAIM 1854 = LMG 25443 TaxID=1229493 RepID=A0A0C1ZA15_9VIBR|nr:MULTISPECIES: DUF1173 family protein [Vibrio]KIF53014.1 hypothetical protein H735_08675 [Vibrio owensii CAIM 1854 = LMG 25443]PAW00445.1 DUF1173 domain-containing protein [Vibrio coralliilyticus]
MALDWKIINKHGDGSKVERLLKDPWWLKSDKRNEPRAQKELQKIYEAEQHILCSCNDARMFARYTNEKYHIVNHPVLGRHSTKCPFYTDISGEISPHEFGGEVEYREIMTFCLHNSLNENPSEHEICEQDEPNDKNGNPRRHKLLRLLYQLCHDSFNYVYYGPVEKRPKSIALQAKLHDAAETIAFGEYKLKDWLYYGAKGHMFAERRLRGLKSWKGPGRPHCFLIEIAEKIDRNGNELALDGESKYYERVIWPGRESTSGPYIILSSLVKDDVDNDVFRHTACVKPIVAHNVLMPIDSNYERTFAISLIEAINRNPKVETDDGRVAKCTLMKPLKPIESLKGEMLLPDFIVQCKVGKEVVRRDIVEVMGFGDTEYAERKKRLIPKMKVAFRGDRVVEISKDSNVDIAKFVGEVFYLHK